VGLLAAPNDRWFTQGFVQVDVPCYGNRLTCVDPLGTITDFGLLSDQTLLFVDICAGYWLHRDEAAPWITGLAALVEIHYTGTLQDADSRVATLDGNAFLFTNPHNRLDMANLTTGVHCQLGQRTALRAAGVFPLTNDANRLFDAEFQFAVDRRF
jgi:hypothetical protein